MSSHAQIDQVRSIDRELARVARGAGALRLRIGEALEVLASRGWHHELGFSSLEAYSFERCARSGRWAAEARAMGRRLAALPLMRSKLAAGALGWSMAELLARHATAETERELVDQAARSTVRAMRSQLSEPRPSEDDEAELRALEVTVDREDCWLVDCTRLLVAHVGGRSSPDETLQALLAEGLSSLVELLPHGTLADLEADLEVTAEDAEPQGRACSAERDAVEERCEARLDLTIPTTPPPRMAAAGNGRLDRVVPDPDFVAHELAYASPEALDAHIHALSAELAERDLAIGLMARALRRADGWRRLGFATEAQYARERLGISLSSLKARLALARSAEWLPGLDAALATGRIGYVAASLVARIATPSTLGEWLERAAERTTKHLREEVEAAELFVRLESRREQPPPAEETMRELAEARRRATVALAALAEAANRRPEGSGRRRRGKGVRPSADRNAPASLLAPEGQTSAGRGETDEAQSQTSEGRVETAEGSKPLLELPPRDAALGSFGAFGRATLRFTVRRETHALFRAVEAVFQRHRARICEEPIGLLHFLCVSFWRVWGITLDPKVAYADIYARDGHECTSPVCTRRDLTPHHLWFRGTGGPDEPWNVTSLCVWCHLLGVHQGRIIALPPSSRIQWRIGRTGAVVVDGRRKLAA